MLDEYEKDRQQLRDLQLVFENAVRQNTMEDMQDHIHTDFSLVSFTDKNFDSFDAFKQQWKITRDTMVGTGRFSVQLNPKPASFINGMAVCQGNADNEMVDKHGKHYQFSSNWTVVFTQVDGAWQVLRVHYSIDPFNNPMLVAKVKKIIFNTALLAFLGGATVTGLMAYALF